MPIQKFVDNRSLVNHTPEELAKAHHTKLICFVMKSGQMIRGFLQFYCPEEVRIKTYNVMADKYISGNKLFGWYYA